MILLDTSSSMLNPFAGNTAKIEYAKYICAALSYLFIKQNDNISIATFDSNFNTILYPTNNKNTLTILDEKLRNIKPKNNDKILTDFNIIAKVKNTFKKSPYICFIISDMIAEKSNILQGLAKINSPINQIYILHLIHNLENNFDFNGYVEIKDPESDKSITTKAGDIKDKFIYMYQQYIKNLRKELLNINIDYNAFLMSRHYSDNILDFLKKHKMN
ncbi:MAG: VWA domain-containing protein [bacterium]